MSGSILVEQANGGGWSVTVNRRQPRYFATLEDALIAAGDVQFTPGGSPGDWDVQIIEPTERPN